MAGSKKTDSGATIGQAPKRTAKRLIIDKAIVANVKKICTILQHGCGEEKLERSIREFVKTQDFIIPPDGALGKLHPSHYPAASTLRKLLLVDPPEVVTERAHPYLPQILDRYIEHHKHLLDIYQASASVVSSAPQPVSILSPADEMILANRAMHLCSNPYCQTPATGPVLSDPSQATDPGVACIIYGATEGEPRFHDQVPVLVNSIENWIWLCPAHAQLVTGAGSIEYTAELLMAWKKQHEQMMDAWMEGRKRAPFSVVPDNSGDPLAAPAIHFLNGLHSLLDTNMPLTAEDMIADMERLRVFVLECQIHVNPGSELDKTFNALDSICEYVLTSYGSLTAYTVPYRFAVFRKACYMGLELLKEKYKI
jgi:hypothetical protein